MNKTKSVRWLFAWTPVVLLGLDVPVTIHPFPLYPRKESSHSNLDRPTSKTPDAALPIPISYTLDAWSQYDNPEDGSAIEGDIQDSLLFRKTVTTDESLIWPNGIVRYFVGDTIVNEPAKLAILEDAMETIMKLTCVRFVRIYPDVNGQFPAHTWVNISGDEQGCFSELGRSGYAPSKMNLNVGRCFRYKGHALHEILHTLGVFHEHMRHDRDKYIEILWDNIREGDALNFRLIDESAVTNYGLPYDYDSIMHYSMTSFSKNKSSPTIVPRKKYAQIGQRRHLSHYDVQKLLITYKCNEIGIEYLDDKINNDHTDRLELPNSNTTVSSHVASGARLLDKSRRSMKSLRDYQFAYPMRTVQDNIPKRLETYQFSYPMQTVQDNVPNTLETYYYEYDYADDVHDPIPTDIYNYYG